jgi:hypothetical protein
MSISNEWVVFYSRKLESLLESEYAATGQGLAPKAQSVAVRLTPEILDLLEQLDLQSCDLLHTENSQPVADFLVRCGQAIERLEILRKQQLAAELSMLNVDGTRPSEREFEEPELDAIAKFMVIRDRVVKTVADFTLKFLLVSAVLLFFGLLLGVI